jgi:hypothetical protein
VQNGIAQVEGHRDENDDDDHFHVS